MRNTDVHLHCGQQLASRWLPDKPGSGTYESEPAWWVVRLCPSSPTLCLKSGPCSLPSGLRNTWRSPTSQSGYQVKPTVCTELTEQFQESRRILQGSGKPSRLPSAVMIHALVYRGSTGTWGLEHKWPGLLGSRLVSHRVYLKVSPPRLPFGKL